VVNDDADDVEAIGNDLGVREPFLDEASVRRTQVDADDAHLLFALERVNEGGKIAFAFSWDDIKDPVVFKVTEGGYKAVAFVEGVFVDTQDHWAKHADAFASLTCSELVVDAGHGGRAEFEQLREIRSRNATVVMFVDFRAEGLGAVASRQDSLKLWNKHFKAPQTAQTPGMNE